MLETMERDHPRGPMLRNAHPRALALVEGELRVPEDLPAALRVGIFQPGARYPAEIRFSSASPAPQPDRVPDLRGVAIKLRGERAWRDGSGAQDLTLVSHPISPFGAVADWHAATLTMNRQGAAAFAARMALSGRAGAVRALAQSFARPTSPLDIRYWSATPCLFGPERALATS